MSLYDFVINHCKSAMGKTKALYNFHCRGNRVRNTDLMDYLYAEYHIALRTISSFKNDSSAYYEPISKSLIRVIGRYQDSQLPDLEAVLKSIVDTQAASSIAAALAAAFLANGKHTQARKLCEIAMGANPSNLFPQRLDINAEEQMNGKVGELEAYLKASFCPAPFSHFETSPNGEVHLCCPGWMDKPIGILENSNWESLWRSDIAQDIRESILDGSFRYCSPRFCNVIAGRRLDVKSQTGDEQLARYKAQGPTSAVFCHDLSCNLSCPSCRKVQIAVGKSEQWKYEALTKNTLIPVMESCHDVKITGSGDPFGSIHFRNLIADYCANHTGPRKLHLHTNGVLLDEKTWTSLKLEENVQDIIISIDATKEDTYKIVLRGGDFARLMKNLEFIGKLRVEGRIDNLIFVCVVQKLNYREIPDFVRMAKRFHADKAEFWQIRNWGTYSIEEFLDHAVAYSNHPEYPALMDILKDPIMNDPIVSWNDLPVPK